MGLIKIKKGLDLPINGKPEQAIKGTKTPKTVALLGEDYVGMKPTMLVAVGDKVKLGQVLFTDKKTTGVKYTSPGSGKVIEINRGEKRAFKSIVIELEGSDEESFKSYSEKEISGISRENVKEELLDSGLWTSLRTRPFSKVANPEKTPNSIFVTAMDTNPLAPSIDVVLKGNEKQFENGLNVISKLTEGKVFVCKANGSTIPAVTGSKIVTEEFEGPHPAGNVGTHIHFLDPVSRSKEVWYLSAQDVVSIGYLFTTGKIFTDRIISLAGSSVKSPKLVKTRIGAAIADIVSGELNEGENRIISGSVLSGHAAVENVAYLGRYHQQVSVIEEGRDRKFLGWMGPGFNEYSFKNVVLSKIIPNKSFDFNTAIHGGKRAIVPSGAFEAVIPMDILPTYLLRSLAVDDVEEAEKLGALELDEEDLALCTFTCPSKLEYGPMLRRNLTLIEKEG